MDHLRQFCVQKMSQSLTSDNVCSVIRIALEYDDETLKENAKKVLVDNLLWLQNSEEFLSLYKEETTFMRELMVETILKLRKTNGNFDFLNEFIKGNLQIF